MAKRVPRKGQVFPADVLTAIETKIGDNTAKTLPYRVFVSWFCATFPNLAKIVRNNQLYRVYRRFMYTAEKKVAKQATGVPAEPRKMRSVTTTMPAPAIAMVRFCPHCGQNLEVIITAMQVAKQMR